VKIEAKIKFWLRRTPWLKKMVKKALRIDAVNSQVADLERKLIYTYIERLHSRISTLEERVGIKQDIILNFGDPRPPRFDALISQASTAEQMLEPTFALWCARLNEKPNFHRKLWEYNYILQALEQHHKLNPGMRGLGFGVGKDPIVAYMVKSGCKIIATDLDPEAAHQAGWVETNQYSEKLLNLNERKICSDKALTHNVELKSVNMNAIPNELSQGQFDFVWSACAYEHLGSIEQGLQFVVNSMNSLKPGGIAVHTTELNVSSNDETLSSGGTVLFRKRDMEDLASRLRNLGYEIELNFHLGSQALDRFYDVPPYSEFTHLKLELDRFITTSYGIIVKKPS